MKKGNAVFVAKLIRREKQKHQRGFTIMTRATQKFYKLVLATSLMKLGSFAVLATEL